MEVEVKKQSQEEKNGEGGRGEEKGEDKKQHILEMAQYKLDLPIVKLQMKETKAGRQRSAQRWQSCPDV